MSAKGLTRYVKNGADLHMLEEYGPVLELIDQSIKEVIEAEPYSESDIRGDVLFFVNIGGNFTPLVKYVVDAEISHGFYFDTVEFYCPKGFSLCEIRILAEVYDHNSVDYGRAAREFCRKIAKAINMRIESDSQRENAYLGTLNALVKGELRPFSIGAMYREAEEIGIVDYRLVDMAVQNLLLDGFLISEGYGTYRRAKQIPLIPRVSKKNDGGEPNEE